MSVKRVTFQDELETALASKYLKAEGDLSIFALRKEHYHCRTELTSNIFTIDTRPHCVRELYDSAGRTSPSQNNGLDSSSSRLSPRLLCTPVLGARQRKLRGKVDVEIETRLPAAIEELRKWTSTEALGDMTVAPGAQSRITANISLEDQLDGGGFSSGDDEPIDHKLPSPEEQFIAIATKFPPELVPIDTSGKGFDRMCHSRRSLLHVDTSCDRNQTGDSQTVRRRTRSKKPRGKRRNTITGTDQKEIRDAIAGDASSPLDEPESPDSGAVMRSHSSDLLKKNPFEVKKSHFNTLRQWGRSRLRLISRSPSDSNREASKEKSKNAKATVQDIDDVNIYETVTMRRKKNSAKTQDRKISHERNNSYSSSEKSIGVPAMPLTNAMSLAVKLREVSTGNRRKRIPAKEEPHSSSGNWSASSESGRTSIGSEITSTTAAPRSTTSAATSSNSINVMHGPPSSIVSRRRFLNTSGSGSVTSEGTLTPDIIHDLHDDMETSSEFSCDTEGYYTSFHMDSGLKTLKEEEISLPITPLHTTNTFSNSSYNQTVLTAESEYELFGKGSTSTTTSSAGTVCTTLLAAVSDRSLVLGPTVPERKSSLSKYNKSRNGSGNLERSCSNSTTGSNSDRMATIKRNTKNNIVKDEYSVKETVIALVHDNTNILNTGAESPDSGHNTSSSPIDDSVSSAHGGKLSCSELDYSESSDLEGIDRIERIRVKTTINSSRIPSMCVITPNNSDDESIEKKSDEAISTRPKLELPPQETDLDTLVFNDETKDYDNVYINNKESIANSMKNETPPEMKKTHDFLNYMKNKKSALTRPRLLPLNNLMCRLKEVFPLRKVKEPQQIDTVYSNDEYVTIADVHNNNQKININNKSGVYYSNDVVKRNLQTVLSGKLQETEYVSLNELPSNMTNVPVINEVPNDSLKRYGAKVTLDSTGTVIYSSDSLKRRKGAHTTFEPGPFVKDQDECDSVTPQTRPLSPQLGKLIIRAPNSTSPALEVVRMPPVNIVTPSVTRPMSPRASKGAYVNIQDAEGISLSPAKDNNQDYRPLADYHFNAGYSTIPSSINSNHLPPNHATKVGEIPSYWTLQHNKTKSLPEQKPSESVYNSTPKHISNSESFKMSPIDPRSVGGFQASTPTQNQPKITSPIKSTMSNEELYAVIHKSKKKMNIKSPPLDRATSPALSATSLSPGSSESSISGRITPIKQPETGYFTDVRVRHSWSPQENPRHDTACADRLGPVPQTSRLDFKKLLLQHGVRLNLHNPNKPPNKPSAVERLRPGNPNVNILDLSGSPKTYTHRRIMRYNNNPSSPSRTNTLIKESKTTPKILLSPKTQWRFSSPRSDVLSSPIPEAFNEDESPNGSAEKEQEPLFNSYKPKPSVKRALIPPIRENIIVDNFDAKIDNSPGKVSRAEFLKAQFLSQNANPHALPPVNSFSKTNMVKSIKETPKCPSPPTLETAL